MNKAVIYLVLALAYCISSCDDATTSKKGDKQSTTASNTEATIDEKLNSKAQEALAYCKANKFNTEYCILIDMSEHSGKKRMFVYDFKQHKVIRSALCAHGCGKDDQRSTGAKPIFGNKEGSLLTSLGKYKIGARAYSQYGINVHYKLHGLESTNDNAFQRIVVLHSHTPLPPIETYPQHLPMGWSYGCPVTDNETMHYLDKLLAKSKQPVLLWIYND